MEFFSCDRAINSGDRAINSQVSTYLSDLIISNQFINNIHYYIKDTAETISGLPGNIILIVDLDKNVAHLGNFDDIKNEILQQLNQDSITVTHISELEDFKKRQVFSLNAENNNEIYSKIINHMKPISKKEIIDGHDSSAKLSS